jgi:hypothetical protein
MALLITGYKNVLLFKKTVTHLCWLFELKDTCVTFADHQLKSERVALNGKEEIV